MLLFGVGSSKEEVLHIDLEEKNFILERMPLRVQDDSVDFGVTEELGCFTVVFLPIQT